MGLLAGVVAKLIMPGDNPDCFIMTILLGVVEAFIGGFIARFFGFGAFIHSFNFGSFVMMPSPKPLLSCCWLPDAEKEISGLF